MEMINAQILNNLIVIKNAKIHINNNEKSINVGESAFIDLTVDKYDKTKVLNIKNWFQKLKQTDIDLFLPGKIQ